MNVEIFRPGADLLEQLGQFVFAYTSGLVSFNFCNFPEIFNKGGGRLELVVEDILVFFLVHIPKLFL